MITFELTLNDTIDVLNKHVVDNAIKNIVFNEQGVIVDRDICNITTYNILLFCYNHYTMFDEEQFSNLDSIFKKILTT